MNGDTGINKTFTHMVAILAVVGFANRGSANSDDYLKKLTSEYDPTITIGVPQGNPHHSTSKCQITTITLTGADPIHFQIRPVVVERYHPVANPPHLGTVIVLPPIVGISILDRFSAREFCNAGLETLVVSSWGFDSELGLEWNVHDKDSLRAVTAARHVIEFATVNKPGPIGLIGTSQGALVASNVLSLDSRASAGVLIVAGGPLSKIVATSTLKLVRNLKKERFKYFNIKDEYQYEDILGREIQIDTTRLAEKAAPKKLWMFIADRDTVIPAETQWQLWKAWKEPAYHIVRFNHVWTVLNTFFFHHKEITRFLVDQLKMP